MMTSGQPPPAPLPTAAPTSGAMSTTPPSPPKSHTPDLNPTATASYNTDGIEASGGDGMECDKTTVVTPVAAATEVGEPALTTSASPPPPANIRVEQTGLLTADAGKRLLLIRGTWAQVGVPAPPSQVGKTTFVWRYNVPMDKEVNELPSNGRFSGSYKIFATEGGKKKGRLVDVVETVERLGFEEKGRDGEGNEVFGMEGKGSNKYGHFVVDGTAVRNAHTGETLCDIVKMYVPQSSEPATVSERHDVKVTCMRGVLQHVEDEQGHVRVFVAGKWSSDRLNLMVEEGELTPEQVVSDFMLEHKSGTKFDKFVFPPDKNIKYAGWFKLLQGDGSLVEVKENDVSFKLIPNNGGGWNVDGRGRNAYGTFTLSGTVDAEYNIELYKHFNTRVTKIKKGPTSNGSVQATASASASPSASASATSFEPPVASFAVPTVDEIELNEGEAVIEEPVAAGGAPNYECYMRGMVKCGGDGITKAEGFWCASKEKSQDKSQTSKFEITHDGSDADGSFPLNSANYSGHFIMKVGATSRKKVAEKHIALKFAKNANNGFNVKGCGINDFGRFAVCGTFIPMGGTSGMLELYKWYTEYAPVPAGAAPKARPVKARAPRADKPAAAASKPWSSVAESSGKPVLKRQPSGRPIKIPNKNFDSTTLSKLSPEMNAMQTILEKLKREDPYKWFSEPIDPVALNIPTYNQVITQPMDLKTLGLRVLQGQVTKPSDFAVECRRIFTNCATFNKPTDDNAFLLDMCKKLHKLFDAEYKTFSSSDATRKREAKAHAEQAEERNRLQQAHRESQKQAAAPPRSSSGSVKRGRSDGGDGGPASKRGSSAQEDRMMQAMEAKMMQMQQMIERQANMIDMVQQQAMANEAKLEISAMAGGSQGGYNAMPTAPSFGGGGGVGVGMPVVAQHSSSMPTFGSGGGGAIGLGDDYDHAQDEIELTYKEQQRLTTAINKLEGDKLNQVLKIIRQDTGVGDDEDEVSISFDELPIKTQRRLQAFLFKKQGQGGGGAKKTAKKPAPKKQAMAEAAPTNVMASMPTFSGTEAAGATEVDAFAFNADLSGFDDGEGMIDGGDVYGGAGIDAGVGADPMAGDDDDLWDGARAQATTNQAILEEQSRRQSAIQTAQNQAGAQRMADAQRQEAHASAQRDAQSAATALATQQKQLKEQAESDAARQQLRREREEVEAAASVDVQSLLMSSLQQDVLDSPLAAGSLSPSGSDYGF